MMRLCTMSCMYNTHCSMICYTRNKHYVHTRCNGDGMEAYGDGNGDGDASHSDSCFLCASTTSADRSSTARAWMVVGHGRQVGWQSGGDGGADGVSIRGTFLFRACISHMYRRIHSKCSEAREQLSKKCRCACPCNAGALSNISPCTLTSRHKNSENFVHIMDSTVDFRSLSL